MKTQIKLAVYWFNIHTFFCSNYVTMVTSDHMNQLLKNVLKLIKNNIGNENAPWMTRIAGIVFDSNSIFLESIETF